MEPVGPLEHILANTSLYPHIFVCLLIVFPSALAPLYSITVRKNVCISVLCLNCLREDVILSGNLIAGVRRCLWVELLHQAIS